MLDILLDVETWKTPSPFVTSLSPSTILSWYFGSLHIRRLVGESKGALPPAVPRGLLVQVAGWPLAKWISW